MLLKIQGSVICSICHDIMFAPFVTSCGHSFCYSCLFDWLKINVSCPTCRESLLQRPVICHNIKDIVEVLTDAVYTTDEDKQKMISQKRKAIEDYEDDMKYTKESFPYIFKDISEDTLNDVDDGVRRCARCQWEVEGPRCQRCGHYHRAATANFPSDDDDESDNELELLAHVPDEYDVNDEFVDDRSLSEILQDFDDAPSDSEIELLTEPSGTYHHSDHDEEEEDDDNSSPILTRTRHIITQVDDDEDDDEEILDNPRMAAIPRGPRLHTLSDTDQEEDEEGEEQEEVPQMASQRSSQPRRVIVVPSSDEESETSDDDDILERNDTGSEHEHSVSEQDGESESESESESENDSADHGDFGPESMRSSSAQSSAIDSDEEMDSDVSTWSD